jgi:F-type H+-transporting ATPase subunit b
MPQLDVATFMPQIAWLVITFVTLFLIVWKGVVPRVGGALETRQRKIEDNLNKAAKFKADAEAVIEAYEKTLANARVEAQSIVAQVKSELDSIAAERQQELDAKVAARISEAETRISKAKTDALTNLQSVTVELAGSAVEKLIGEAADSAALAGAVDAAAKARN